MKKTRKSDESYLPYSSYNRLEDMKKMKKMTKRSNNDVLLSDDDKHLLATNDLMLKADEEEPEDYRENRNFQFGQFVPDAPEPNVGFYFVNEYAYISIIYGLFWLI